MSYKETQIYGAKVFRLKPDKRALRSREVHGLQQFWQTDAEDYFALQDAPPDYEHMRIVEIESDLEIPDEAYAQRIECEGILDDSLYIEIDRAEQSPEEGWDEIRLQIFTRDPDAARWQKGQRLQSAVVPNVTAEADDDILTKINHGLVTGQLCGIEFASGFTGLTTGSFYYAIRLSDSTFKLATTAALAGAGTGIDITADGTEANITPIPVGFEFMFIAERGHRVHRARDYYMLDLTLRGVKGAKPYKRRINGAVTSSASTFDGYTLLTADIWENFPPTDSGSNATLSGTDLDLEYDSASISISDSYLSSEPPPTDKVGQFWTPPDAPDVSVLTLSGVGTKYFFPFGWKCASMPAEKLAGADVWIITVNYIYQPLTMPTT